MERASRVISASYCIIIFILSDPITFFSTLFKKMARLAGGGGWIIKKMCVLFSLRLLSATFLILKRIRLVIIINAYRTPCKVQVILVRF
jgi:hypothetical protein